MVDVVYKPFNLGDPTSVAPKRDFYDFMQMIHRYGVEVRAEDVNFDEGEEEIYTTPEGKVAFVMSVTCAITMRDGVFGSMYLSLAYPSSTLINRFFAANIAGESGTSTVAENQTIAYPIPIKVEYGKCLRFNTGYTPGSPSPFFQCFVSCLIYEVDVKIYEEFLNKK